MFIPEKRIKDYNLINSISNSAKISEIPGILDSLKEIHIFPSNYYDDVFRVSIINKCISLDLPDGVIKNYDNLFNNCYVVKINNYILTLSEKYDNENDLFNKENKKLELNDVLDSNLELSSGISSCSINLKNVKEDELDFEDLGFSIFKVNSEPFTSYGEIDMNTEIKFQSSVFSNFEIFDSKELFIGTIDHKFYTERHKRFIQGKKSDKYSFKQSKLRDLIDEKTKIIFHQELEEERFGEFSKYLKHTNTRHYLEILLESYMSKWVFLLTTQDFLECEFICDMKIKDWNITKVKRSFSYSPSSNFYSINHIYQIIYNDILFISQKYKYIKGTDNLYIIIKVTLSSIVFIMKDCDNNLNYCLKLNKANLIDSSIEDFLNSVTIYSRMAEKRIETNMDSRYKPINILDIFRNGV